MNDSILIHILVYLNILSLIIGYILGKINKNHIDHHTTKNHTNTTSVRPSNNITIDEKKIVVDINTEGLEKKYESLGKNTQKENNISGSINKLKNLKG